MNLLLLNANTRGTGGGRRNDLMQSNDMGSYSDQVLFKLICCGLLLRSNALTA